MKTYKIVRDRVTGWFRVKYMEPEYGAWFWARDEAGEPREFRTLEHAQMWIAWDKRQEEAGMDSGERWEEVEG